MDYLALGFQFFGLYLAPAIAIIVWLWILFRLRTWILVIALISLVLFILISSANPLVALIGNPYFVVVLLISALVNCWIAANDSNRLYLLRANLVFLGMMAALHAWARYIRQREIYFYQQSDLATTLWFGFVAILGLAIIIVGLLRFFRR